VIAETKIFESALELLKLLGFACELPHNIVSRANCRIELFFAASAQLWVFEAAIAPLILYSNKIVDCFVLNLNVQVNGFLEFLLRCKLFV